MILVCSGSIYSNLGIGSEIVFLVIPGGEEETEPEEESHSPDFILDSFGLGRGML